MTRTGPGTAAGQRPHVVVVGGGIAGLAAAHALVERSGGDVAVTLLEGAPVLGGKLALTDVAGVEVDAGAESLLARRTEAISLAHEVGLGDDLVHPAVGGASVWSRGAMRPLPAGQLMGIPGDLRALAASQVRVAARAGPDPAGPRAVPDAGARRRLAGGVRVGPAGPRGRRPAGGAAARWRLRRARRRALAGRDGAAARGRRPGRTLAAARCHRGAGVVVVPPSPELGGPSVPAASTYGRSSPASVGVWDGCRSPSRTPAGARA